MGSLRPIYCRFCEQTLLSDNLERCSACGRVGGLFDSADDPSRLAALVAQKKAEPMPVSYTLGQTARDTLWVYRSLKLALSGLLCIGLGLAMIFVPDLRDKPSTISFSDVMKGSITSFVGLFLVGLVFLFMRRAK